MKKVLLILLCCISVGVKAQDASNYIIKEKLVFHQLDILETETDKLIDSFPEGSGMILSVDINSTDYLCISIPDVHTYNIQIVNRVEDKPSEDIKVVMLQGGETVEINGEKGTYTANIFFVYDLRKNSETPEFVRLQINGSPNILKFSGIIKLRD